MTNEMTIEQMQAMLAQLSAKVEDLESKLEKVSPDGMVDEQTKLVIAAACAAYLGKRPIVKQVHMRRASSWTSIGRSTVHRSHRAGA